MGSGSSLLLPSLLTAERRKVEVAPSSHHFVAAVIDEICAEHPITIAEEHVVAVPFIDADCRFRESVAMVLGTLVETQ